MSRRAIGLPRCQIFESERHARVWLESRAWKDGPICPHCGNAGHKRITPLRGRSHRPGLYQCNSPSCRRQFTVTVGTLLEDSKIPLHKWLAALFLISTTGERVPVTHVHRALGISYKSSWFMVHRLRQALPQAEPLATTKGLGHALRRRLRVDEGEQDTDTPPPTTRAKPELDRGPPSEPMTLKEAVHQLNHILEHSSELRALIFGPPGQRAGHPQEPAAASAGPDGVNRGREHQSEGLPAHRKPPAEAEGPSGDSQRGQTQPLYSSEAYPHGSDRWSKQPQSPRKQPQPREPSEAYPHGDHRWRKMLGD